jgi:hypothetical protein
VTPLLYLTPLPATAVPAAEQSHRLWMRSRRPGGERTNTQRVARAGGGLPLAAVTSHTAPDPAATVEARP